jgi:hypothetical protein
MTLAVLSLIATALQVAIVLGMLIALWKMDKTVREAKEIAEHGAASADQAAKLGRQIIASYLPVQEMLDKQKITLDRHETTLEVHGADIGRLDRRVSEIERIIRPVEVDT